MTYNVTPFTVCLCNVCEMYIIIIHHFGITGFHFPPKPLISDVYGNVRTKPKRNGTHVSQLVYNAYRELRNYPRGSQSFTYAREHTENEANRFIVFVGLHLTTLYAHHNLTVDRVQHKIVVTLFLDTHN